MYRITFFLFLFVYLLLPQSFARASESLNNPEVLKSRQVIGVIYFKNDNIKLSPAHRTEIDRIASQFVAQFPSDKIVRVEGFTTKGSRQADPLTTSLSRAKSVWHYLKKMNSFNSNTMYLTGFNTQQSLSELQGERVEIVIYENPFKEKIKIYSSN